MYVIRFRAMCSPNRRRQMFTVTIQPDGFMLIRTYDATGRLEQTFRGVAAGVAIARDYFASKGYIEVSEADLASAGTPA